MENIMYNNSRGYEDDLSLGSRSMMDISTSNRGLPTTTANQDQFTRNGEELSTTGGGEVGAVVTNLEINHHHGPENRGKESIDKDKNCATAEAEDAVTNERHMLYKENQRLLTSTLDKMKNATQAILSEMSTYLKESEEVEKTYIRCRANTQKESERLESVEPDVVGATARFQQGQAGMFAVNGFM